MTPLKPIGAPKLTGSIIHKGREYHAGDTVPDGVDMERLERLGLVGKKADIQPSE